MFFYTYTEPLNTKYKRFIEISGTFYGGNSSLYDGFKVTGTTDAYKVLWAWHNQFINFCLTPLGYDVYVKSRCDITLSDKVAFERYYYDDGTVYIPEGNDFAPGAVNDQFAFGNYESMKKYFSVYLNHERLFDSGVQFHPETYLAENMRRLGVNIVRIPITNTIVR